MPLLNENCCRTAAKASVASHADILWARHAILPNELWEDLAKDLQHETPEKLSQVRKFLLSYFSVRDYPQNNIEILPSEVKFAEWISRLNYNKTYFSYNVPP